MSRQLQLNAAATAVLDDDGDGQVQIGPPLPGVTWAPLTGATSTTSTVNTPLFSLYLGEPSPLNFLGGTYDGSNDSTDLSVTLQHGQYLTGVWTGGDPGASATLSLAGTDRPVIRRILPWTAPPDPPIPPYQIPPAVTAFQNAVGLDWLNAARFGAVGDGTTDVTSNIQAAINAAAPGQVVYLPPGIYLTTGPIVMQRNGAILRGSNGILANGPGFANNVQSATIIRPASTWANPLYSPYASGVILLIDSNPGTAQASEILHCRLSSFLIDGSTGPAAVDGVASFGAVHSVNLDNVGIYGVTGNGFACYNDTAAPGDGQADAWHWARCTVQSAAGHGWTGQINDSTWLDCHAQTCTGDGFQFQGSNSQVISCRADQCANGFTTDAQPGGGGDLGTIRFIGCGTEANNQFGLNVANSSSSGSTYRQPVIVSGCGFAGDGVNNGNGGGGFAGIGITGKNIVTISETAVIVRENQVSAPGCPQYGIATGNPGRPLSVRMTSGLLNYVTAADNGNAGNAVDYLISPNVAIAQGFEPATWTSY